MTSIKSSNSRVLSDGGAIDERTTQQAGYAISQQKRKRIEQSFGWMKIIGMLKKVKLRGLQKVSWLFTFVGAVNHPHPATAQPCDDSVVRHAPPDEGIGSHHWANILCFASSQVNDVHSLVAAK